MSFTTNLKLFLEHAAKNSVIASISTSKKETIQVDFQGHYFENGKELEKFVKLLIPEYFNGDARAACYLVDLLKDKHYIIPELGFYQKHIFFEPSEEVFVDIWKEAYKIYLEEEE